MRPLREMPRSDLADAPGVATDLDDTLTSSADGLGLVALESLHALAAAGLPCVIATGRPIGWAQVLAALLPVRAVVAENGGAWAVRESHGVRVAFFDDDATRRESLDAARVAAESLLRMFPELSRVTDFASRETDVVLDIGERVRVPDATVRAALDALHARGLHGVASTLHLHISTRAPDKSVGIARALADVGLDAGSLCSRWIYVGDSPNDAPAFAAIERSVGVRNVERFAEVLSAKPAYVTDHPGPQGFAELVSAMLSARRGPL